MNTTNSMLLYNRLSVSTCMQAKSSCSFNGDVLTPRLKRRIYHQAMTKSRHRLSLRSRLGGLLSRPQSKRAALAPLLRARECISMAPRTWQPRLCTRHNNSDQSWVASGNGGNGNRKLKRKTEAEIGNGKAEIGKWSSTFVALMAPFAHARSVSG